MSDIDAGKEPELVPGPGPRELIRAAFSGLLPAPRDHPTEADVSEFARAVESIRCGVTGLPPHSLYVAGETLESGGHQPDPTDPGAWLNSRLEGAFASLVATPLIPLGSNLTGESPEIPSLAEVARLVAVSLGSDPDRDSSDDAYACLLLERAAIVLDRGGRPGPAVACLEQMPIPIHRDRALYDLMRGWGDRLEAQRSLLAERARSGESVADEALTTQWESISETLTTLEVVVEVFRKRLSEQRGHVS